MSWAFVQSKGTASGNVASASITFDSSVTVGNLLVVNVTVYNQSVAPAIIDSTGANTWHTAAFKVATAGANGITLVFWCVPVTGGGSFVVTVTPGAGNSYTQIMAGEFSAPAGTISVDVSGTGEGLSSTIDPGTLTLGSTDLVVSVGNSGGALTATAGSGFTIPTGWNQMGAPGEPSVAEYLLNATVSSDPTIGLSGTTTWQAVGVAFKATAAPPATTGAALLMAI